MTEILVETYEVEEAEWAGAEMTDEQKHQYEEIAERLNLTPQTEIIKGEGHIPFRRLTEAEERVWKAYCPYSVTMGNYREKFPLRALILLDHCVQRRYFSEIQVWSESEVNPDPVAVGVAIPDPTRSYNKVYYLIVRWGEALENWQEIVKQAKRKWLEKSKASLEAKRNSCKIDLDSLEQKAIQYFGGEAVYLND